MKPGLCRVEESLVTLHAALGTDGCHGYRVTELHAMRQCALWPGSRPVCSARAALGVGGVLRHAPPPRVSQSLRLIRPFVRPKNAPKALASLGQPRPRRAGCAAVLLRWSAGSFMISWSAYARMRGNTRPGATLRPAPQRRAAPCIWACRKNAALHFGYVGWPSGASGAPGRSAVMQFQCSSAAPRGGHSQFVCTFS